MIPAAAPGADAPGAKRFPKRCFHMDMAPVLTQMGILVFIMAVGFITAKLGVTGPSSRAPAPRWCSTSC